MQSLKVGMIQMDMKWMDPWFNLDKIDAILESEDKADLWVLPEMFNTGYVLNPKLCQISDVKYTIEKLIELADKHQSAICGSIPFMERDKYYNRLIVVSKDGILYHYDKVHLFTPAGESKWYSKGEFCEDFEINGVRIRPLICYDLRFPYLSFNNTFYDILLYVANWPSPRIQHWKSLLIARAIENQSYVIGINRTGKDQNGYEYNGQSMLIRYDGETMLNLGSEECREIHTIDKESIQKYRAMLPFLVDQQSGFSI